MRSMLTMCILSLGVAGCHNVENKEPAGVGANPTMCEILKQNVIKADYWDTDPSTMKRKNAVDQAKSVKEYNSYNCAEVVDSAPNPYETYPDSIFSKGQ